MLQKSTFGPVKPRGQIWAAGANPPQDGRGDKRQVRRSPSALTPVPADWPGNAQNASACRGKRLDRGLKTLKTRTPRGYYFGGLQPFSPCLSMKRASRNAPQANKPMMAFSPTCRWKGHFERFRRPWGSKHFTKALGSLGDRAPLGLSNPFP